jgi:transposase-like protein
MQMSSGDLFAPNLAQADRRCPWCASADIRLISRGYTGPTDEVDQYFTCAACGKTTYELVAKSAREMRLGRYRAGGVYKDGANQTKYQISRVLKVGINEFLIYLKPLVEDTADQRPRVAGT